jgi:phosphotransferase family enzyme
MVLTPRRGVLAFSRSAEALGSRPCLVCSLRPSRTLTALHSELTCTQRREVYRQLGEVLNRLHAIPVGGYGAANHRARTCQPSCPDSLKPLVAAIREAKLPAQSQVVGFVREN